MAIALLPKIYSHYKSLLNLTKALPNYQYYVNKSRAHFNVPNALEIHANQPVDFYLSVYSDIYLINRTDGINLMLSQRLMDSFGILESEITKTDLPTLVIPFSNDTEKLDSILRHIVDKYNILLLPGHTTFSHSLPKTKYIGHEHVQLEDSYGQLEKYFSKADIVIYGNHLSRVSVGHNPYTATMRGKLFTLKPRYFAYGYKELNEAGSVEFFNTIKEMTARLEEYGNYNSTRRMHELKKAQEKKHQFLLNSQKHIPKIKKIFDEAIKFKKLKPGLIDGIKIKKKDEMIYVITHENERYSKKDIMFNP